jgi:hypothetical protein
MDTSRDPKIQGWFPLLNPNEYEFTSPETDTYNCIAWAAGETDRWWEPSSNPKYYWPKDAPNDDRIGSLLVVFSLLNYEVCENASLEPGYEKIAIYGDADDSFTHASRQLGDGKWTSKLGPDEDISHKTLEGLTGPGQAYGTVVIIMRRKILTAPDTPSP